ARNRHCCGDPLPCANRRGNGADVRGPLADGCVVPVPTYRSDLFHPARAVGAGETRGVEDSVDLLIRLEREDHLRGSPPCCERSRLTKWKQANAAVMAL